jgi:hypothetical protein
MRALLPLPPPPPSFLPSSFHHATQKTHHWQRTALKAELLGMLRVFKRPPCLLTRPFSSQDNPGHYIDGITIPRSPPASRSSNPCALRNKSIGPPPLWLPTHSVFNQASPLHNFDAYESDRALVECTRALQSAFPAQTLRDGPLLSAVSTFASSSSSQIIHEHAFLAHANPPVLSTHDRTGTRRDQVDYHPSYVICT